MPKFAPPKIRLADVKVDGAEVYNFYQLNSMLSSLYVKAIDRQDEPEINALWDSCATSILTQIGLAHDCWQMIQERKTSGIPLPVHESLVKRSLALANRFSLADLNLTAWETLHRWSRLISKFEIQLQNFGMQLIATDPFLLEGISAMNDHADARIKLVQSIESLAISQDKEYEKNFALPVML